MAKRRLNKNLVAFLTAAGIVLAVVVAGIAALNASQRDPAAIAAKAKAEEQANDLKRALDLYRRAYAVNKEAKYLVEAARCAHEMGEFGEMFMLLNFAQAQSPRDPEVLNALLQRYWEMRDFAVRRQWRDVLENAESLLGLEPENLLALALKAEALDQLKEEEPGYATEADAVLRRALEIDATDPHVALVWINRTRARAIEQVREAREGGRPADAERLYDEAHTRQIEFLQTAVAAHPDDVSLRTVLAQVLFEGEQWEQGRALLEAGLTDQPDDPQLHYAIATILVEDIRRNFEEASQDEVRKLVDDGVRHVNKALEVEPALYRAYNLRADLQRFGWVKDGRWESEPLACQKTILESLRVALRDTVGLKSLRAALGRGDRLFMIGYAFQNARGFYGASADEAVRSQALTYLKLFLQEAKAQYPEHALVSLMEGHLALVDNDERTAISAFREAEKRGGADQFGRAAKEELVRLYRKSNELGLSLRYTDEVIGSYQAQRQVPPVWVWANKAELLLALDRAQDALDLLDAVAMLYPDELAFKAIRARTLALLGRAEEGVRLLADSASEDPRLLLDQARLAAFNQDYDNAAVLLRKVLKSNPESLPTIRLLIQVLLAAQRAEEATQFINERVEQISDGRVRRVLQAYEVMLSTTDPAQREQKLLELIAAVPDDFERAAEYFNYWVSRRDFERALTYLEQMEALRKDDAKVLELQFNLARQVENCERAERYATRLAQLNADHVGGAAFRGRYELSCGDPEKAISELRAVEREFPTDSQLKIEIANALLRTQPPRYDEAIQTLERTVEFDPRSFPARKWLYICYEQTGRRQEGIPHLEVAAKLNPEDSFVKESAQLLEEERDPRRGIARREPLREQNPDDTANLLRLAELYERVNDNTRAEECLRAAAQVDPASIQAAAYGANFYAKRGNRQAGEQLLERHLDTQEGLGKVDARVLFGRFYEQLGDQEAALNAYQQAYERVDEMLPAGSEDRQRALAVTATNLGEFYQRTQRYQEMIDTYRLVLTHLKPTESASIQMARLRIIGGLLAARQYGEAGEEIAAYRREFPKDPRGLKVEAELLLARNKLDEARDLLSRVLQDSPDDVWSRYTRGSINVEQGRYTEARDDLLRAKAVAPEALNLKHRLQLVRLYEITEQPELAEAELRELLPLTRDNREVELRLIGLLRNTGQIQKAQEFVNELSARQPDEPFWHHQLGSLLTARGEYGAAVEPFRRAVELTEGNNPQVIADWLLALTRGARAAEAIQAYESCKPQVITPRIQTFAAEAYLAQNQRDVAVALLEQGVNAGSLRSVSELRFVVAQAVSLLGREEGLMVLRRVLEYTSSPAAELALRSTLAWYLVGDEDPARRAEGLEVAQAVIADAPADSPVRMDALLVKARALESAGQYEDVARTYEELLEVDPDNPHALNNLAYLLASELNRPAEALPYAERARDVAVDDENKANILDTLGWVYFQNGKTEQAEATLLEALRIASDNLAARYHLGRLYADSGRRPAAQRAFSRLLEVAREQEDDQDTRKADRAKEYVQKADEALEQLR